MPPRPELHCPPRPESKDVLAALATSGHTLQMLTGECPAAELTHVVEPWFLGAGAEGHRYGKRTVARAARHILQETGLSHDMFNAYKR